MKATYESALDRRIYTILRDNCDAPRVLFQSDEPLLLARHGTRKRTILICTKYYTYLIKQKGYKLYHRWLNRTLLIEARQSELHLSMAESMGPTEIATACSSNGDYTKVGRESGNDGDEFKRVTLSTRSLLEAVVIEEKINLLIHSAQRTAALLELEEAGEVASMVNACDVAAAADDDDAEGDSDSSGNEGAEDELLATMPRGTADATASRFPVATGSFIDAQQKLLQMAPSRYIAITSLVDGEFADYAALKNACMRHEEENLLSDLAVFIKLNEGQVETLCEHHYPAFIYATQQCLTISEKDAQLVGEELSGATALVRSAVVEMKQAAASLIQSRSSHDNLACVHSLLRRATVVAEYLETAEAQVEKQQLIGAITSLRELVRLSVPLAEHTLGEYVLQIRVPALTQRVFTYALQRLNTWLKFLRDQADVVGGAAFAWEGKIAAGAFLKSIVFGPHSSVWGIEERFEGAITTFAPLAHADTIAQIASGASIQGVFYELRREDYVHRYYAEGRAQQAKADVVEPAAAAVEGVSGRDLVDGFRKYCTRVLGFMLIEDVVYHATSPPLQSSAEVLKSWDRLASATAERARAVSRALASDASYTQLMVEVFTTLRFLIQHVTTNVKCVELSPLVLIRVVETLSDYLISSLLQAACAECSHIILTDPMEPLVIDSAAQFEAKVGRFHLNACPALELPVPAAYSAGNVSVCFSCIVPLIGEEAIRFVSQCYAVVVVNAAAAIRQSELNNVDEMLLKYVSVLFRTVAECMQAQLMSLGQGAVLQLATFISSCAAMPVLVSCVEQQFMLNWAGSDTGSEKQAMGSPQLLAQCAAFFDKPLQRGIEALLEAIVKGIEDRLRPTARLSYWKVQAELHAGKRRQSNTSENEGLGAAMDYLLDLIPQMALVLQTTVLKSISGAAVAHAAMLMQSNIQAALYNASSDVEHDFALMRRCLKEFETHCTVLIPLWQRRLGETMGNLSAAQRFPLPFSSLVEELGVWVDCKEAQQAADKVHQPPLLAGIEMTGRVFAKGFKAVSNTVAVTANAFVKE